jgi:hypothetical protein
VKAFGGKFTETVDLLDVGSVQIVAAAGTQLTATPAGPILHIHGTSAVGISNLEIFGATGLGGIVQLDDTVAVTLDHVSVHDGAAWCVLVNGGALVVKSSTIAKCATGGMQLGGGGTFMITTNFIAANGQSGNQGSTYGGVHIVTAGAGSRLAWNTIVDNGTDNNAGDTAGVACDVGGVDGTGNLLFNNKKGGSPSHVSGTCGFSGYLGTNTDPSFKDRANFDLHLTAASTEALDMAGTTCDPTDIDGESRPYPVNCDYGADEYH